MKLLFDENLSAKLVELLADEYPGSGHVEHLLGRGRTDAEVWEYASTQGYTIVSKDNDFRQRAPQLGAISRSAPKEAWEVVPSDLSTR